MMKRWMGTWIVFGCAMVLLVGCPPGKDTKDTKDGEKPKFQLYSSGIAKYDQFFRRVYDIRYKLWESNKQMNGIPGTLRSILETPGDVKQADTGQLLKAVASKFAEKIVFLPGTGVRLHSGVSDPKAQKVAATLDQVYQTVYVMPKNLGDTVEESKQLVIQGKDLTASVPKDFTGFNALKAPRVSAELAESGKEMGLVPGQVARLGKSSVNVAKQFPAVFRSKN